MSAKHVLLETLATKTQGRAILFKRMTAIGPMNTAARDEAAVFATEADAKACPANWHGLSFYRAVPAASVDATVADIIGSAKA